MLTEKKCKNKVVVILGPNASGKSDIAIRLAKDFNGEIISADSRQVYRGMDIGSGKVKGYIIKDGKFTVYVSDGVPHYMISIVSPKTDFNVAKYKRMAFEALKHIISKKKIPIICGGTGFWIKSIVDDLPIPRVKPDWKLRKKLSILPCEKLYDILKKKDPERTKDIDKFNKIRLIRAIEICEKIGKVPKIINSKREKLDFLQIGIKWPKEVLHERIKKRLQDRLKKGMIEEVYNLHKSGVTWKRLESFGLEYRWVSKYIKGEITKKDMFEKLYLEIKHYAKRQMTWFKRDNRIIWLNSYTDIFNIVKNFLKVENS